MKEYKLAVVGATGLVGRKVIVVTNLKPVKIRGVESNGMVLCAADGEKLELIEIKEASSGSIVR